MSVDDGGELVGLPFVAVEVGGDEVGDVVAAAVAVWDEVVGCAALGVVLVESGWDGLAAEVAGGFPLEDLGPVASVVVVSCACHVFTTVVCRAVCSWCGVHQRLVLCLCSSCCDVLCSLVEQSVLFGFEVRNFDCVVSVACCAESCSVVEETVTEFAWCHR